MRIFLILAAAFAAVTTVFATEIDVSEIPKCAIPCILSTLGRINCTATDQACMCLHGDAMSRDMMPCLLHSCPMNETLKMSQIHATMCDQPPESRQKFLLEVTIACFTVQVCFIFMKLITRGWIQRKLWPDDWILAAAMVTPFVGSAILLWTIYLGLGVHMWQVNADDVTHILGGFLISEASYPWTLGLVRISLLVFFLQTFPDHRFQMCVKLLIGYTCCHTIAFFLVIVFQCSPVPYAWDKTLEGKCVNLTALTYAAAVMSGVLDILTFIAPITQLRKLQMSINKKLGVMLIFAIGSCGCIAGLIRVKEIGTFSNDIAQDPDITWNYVNITYWTEVEITAMILCTCIPSLRPLVIRVVPTWVKDVPSKVLSYWSATRSRGTVTAVSYPPKSAASTSSDESKVYPTESIRAITPAGRIITTRSITTRTDSLHYGDDARWLAFPPPTVTKVYSEKVYHDVV